MYDSINIPQEIVNKVKSFIEEKIGLGYKASVKEISLSDAWIDDFEEEGVYFLDVELDAEMILGRFFFDLNNMTTYFIIGGMVDGSSYYELDDDNFEAILSSEAILFDEESGLFKLNKDETNSKLIII